MLLLVFQLLLHFCNVFLLFLQRCSQFQIFQLLLKQLLLQFEFFLLFLVFNVQIKRVWLHINVVILEVILASIILLIELRFACVNDFHLIVCLVNLLHFRSVSTSFPMHGLSDVLIQVAVKIELVGLITRCVRLFNFLRFE
jgi:hypothetical protein